MNFNDILAPRPHFSVISFFGESHGRFRSQSVVIINGVLRLLLPAKASIQLTDQLVDADSALSRPTYLRKKFSITVAKKGGHSYIG